MNGTPNQDVAFRVLQIEQQLESYRRLHAEELDQIRRALEELKEQVLLLARQEDPASDRHPDSSDKGDYQ